MRIILEPPIHMTEATREFIAHARTDVEELAMRLKEACHALRQFKVASMYNGELLADKLEAPLEGNDL